MSEVVQIERRSPRERLFELALGHTGNLLINHSFDYLLYPFVIFKLGVLYGGSLMAVLSLVSCLLTLWFYDWAKRDWLGIEAVKMLRTYDGDSKIRRFVSRLLQRGDWIACVLLSMKFDPFITTAYMRRGQFNGMTARDWKIFFASWVIANAYWIFVCYCGLSGLRKLWDFVAGSN